MKEVQELTSLGEGLRFGDRTGGTTRNDGARQTPRVPLFTKYLMGALPP